MRAMLPPPPLPQGGSPWETRILAEIEKQVASWVRRTWGLSSASMDSEDGVQKLYIEVILACRRWQAVHGPTKPEMRYIWAAVHRAKLKLWRTVARTPRHVSMTPTPAGESGPWSDVEREVSDATNGYATAFAPDDPETRVASFEERERCSAVVGRLFASLDEPDRRLMELHAQGLTGVEIAEAVGRPGDNGAVVQRLYQLRRRARHELRGLGIKGVDDVYAWSLRAGPTAD